MAKITPAPGRGLLAASAMFGLLACQNATVAGGRPPDAFDVLSERRWAARAPSGFEVLVAKVEAARARPAAAAVVGADTLPAASTDGSAFTAAHGFPEWEPPPTTAAPAPLVVPTAPSEWFNPRGRHEGTEGIVADLAKLGVTDNGRLYVNECWGRTWGASTSDHHRSQTRSWACDLSVPGVQVPTPEAQEAAERIGSSLGEPGWKGGNLRKTVDGYRIQVLWKVAGHFDHVHIGVRKA